MRASKPFTEPEQVPAILAELNGPGGPFRDFTVTRTKSLTRAKTTFTGTVDLAAGLTGLADPSSPPPWATSTWASTPTASAPGSATA